MIIDKKERKGHNINIIGSIGVGKSTLAEKIL